jgi:hypothetical protein
MATVEECIALVLALPEKERARVLEEVRATLPKHPVEIRLKTDTRTLLEAIGRANPFTIRGIEGIIAEAVFALDVLPKLDGWIDSTTPGNDAFDFLLSKAGRPSGVRLQVKMQRRKAHVPLLANQVEKARKWPASHYVVEVQRTRGGKAAGGESTRPYRFGEFDVLAVSLGASTGYWGDFVFTVADWLLPDSDKGAILKFQPVAREDCPDWTSSFDRVVQWLDSGQKRKILS